MTGPLIPTPTAQPAPAPPSATTPPQSFTLVSSLEALPGSVLAWATQSGAKTSEGLAAVLGVPLTAALSFVLAFAVSHNFVGSEQAQAAIDVAVPAGASLAAGWVIRGYTAARAAVKAEAIRLHLVR